MRPSDQVSIKKQMITKKQMLIKGQMSLKEMTLTMRKKLTRIRN